MLAFSASKLDQSNLSLARLMTDLVMQPIRLQCGVHFEARPSSLSGKAGERACLRAVPVES